MNEEYSAADKHATEEATTPTNPAHTTDIRMHSSQRDSETWSQVVSRKQAKRERKRAARSRSRSQAQKKPTPSTKGPTTTRRRLPKTAAVSIVSRSSQVSYADILKEAKNRVDLQQLSIEETRIKRAITGGIVIEIPGEHNNQKADALATQLRQAFQQSEEVSITRPTKRAELRLSGLDDSTTTLEVQTVLADVGKCAPQDIRTGNIRFTPRGLGTLWVQCPLSAALQIAARERMRLGWTYTRATLLKQRPLQCFRCFERGHVRQNCTNPVDRSTRCYNCGSTAHQARDYRYRMKCPICSDFGLPAYHKVGGEACNPPKRANAKRSSAPIPQTSNVTTERTEPTVAVDATEPMVTVTPTLTQNGSAPADYASAEQGGMAWEEAPLASRINVQNSTINHVKKSNINHARQAQDTLMQTLREERVSIAIVAEPYLVPRHPCWIEDKDSLVAITWQPYVGQHHCTPLYAGSGFVIVEYGDTVIIGGYLSPTATLNDLELYLDAIQSHMDRYRPRPIILAGDFNCKATQWGSSVTTAKGALLVDWATA